MLRLPTKQIFNIYILQIYLVYKNHRLFLAKNNYKFYCKAPEVRKLNN